jgi:hypothetical protein
MNQVRQLSPTVRTKGEAKQFIAEVYTIINQGRKMLYDTCEALREPNDKIVLSEYIGFIDDAMSVLEERWRETITSENDRVMFRFPDNIRTEDGSSTVFGKGQLLTHMLNVMDKFGEDFGLDLGLRKELNTTESYKLFHGNGSKR